MCGLIFFYRLLCVFVFVFASAFLTILTAGKIQLFRLLNCFNFLILRDEKIRDVMFSYFVHSSRCVIMIVAAVIRREWPEAPALLVLSMILHRPLFPHLDCRCTVAGASCTYSVDVDKCSRNSLDARKVLPVLLEVRNFQQLLSMPSFSPFTPFSFSNVVL